MKRFIDRIIRDKQLELTVKKRNDRDFCASILQPGNMDMALIAEVKLASPTEGNLGDITCTNKIMKAYQQDGADAISVVVDKVHFEGSMKLVTLAKQAVSLPVLCKDFIIDEYQIYEAKMYGADALLLIARILSDVKLHRMVRLVRSLGMEPVVEVSGKNELKKAFKSGAKMIAANARSFSDLSVDTGRACEILKLVPDTFVKLGFSGISSFEDVMKYKNAGAKAMLVGTSLMKTKNIRTVISELKGIGKV